MSTSICFDFGNTRLKAAIFINKDLQKVHVFEQAKHGSPKKQSLLL
jgi:hypothetical protein